MMIDFFCKASIETGIVNGELAYKANKQGLNVYLI